jgi:hypothetical protein
MAPSMDDVASKAAQTTIRVSEILTTAIPAMPPKRGSAKDKIFQELRKKAKPYLTLKPARSSDQVRRYLKKRGLPLAKARSVIDNLVEFMAVREAWKFLNRRKISIPNAENLTQSELDAEVIKMAEAQPDGETKIKFESWFRNRFLPTKQGAYKISQGCLDEMIAWKKRRKSTGGKRSVAKASKGASQLRSASGKFLAKKT